MDKARPRTFDYSAFIDECRGLIDRALSFDREEASAYSVEFRRWRLELEDLLARIAKLEYSPGIHVRTRYFHGGGEDASSFADRSAFATDMQDTINEMQLLVKRFDTYGDPNDSGDDLNARLDEAWVNHDVVSLQLQETRDELSRAKDELRETTAALESNNQVLAAETAKNEAMLAAFDEREALIRQREVDGKPLAAPDKLTIRWLVDHMPFTGWAKVASIIGVVFLAGVTVGNWPSVQAIVAHWAK